MRGRGIGIVGKVSLLVPAAPSSVAMEAAEGRRYADSASSLPASPSASCLARAGSGFVAHRYADNVATVSAVTTRARTYDSLLCGILLDRLKDHKFNTTELHIRIRRQI